MVPIEPAEIEKAAPFKQNREYQLIAQIGQAVALPDKKNYNIKMTIGGTEIIFEPKK